MTVKDKVKYLSMSEVAQSQSLTTVLYGDTGKRKTTTAARMCNKGLYVSADSSWVVLNKAIHEDLRERLTYVEFDSASQLTHLDVDGYDHLILDTATAMVDRYLDLLFDEATWGGKYREKITSQHPELKGLATTAPVDYKVTRDTFRPIFNHLRKLPVHRIFLMPPTAPPLEGLTRNLERRPRLPGATWQIIAEFANIIGYLEGNDNKGFTVGMAESATSYIGKSQVEGIAGRMNLDEFVAAYRERTL